METLLLYITETLPEQVLGGLRFEAVRYAIGTLGVFFAIWVLLAPLLKNRRIRKSMPRKRLFGQVRMELLNSLLTICVFVALDIVVIELAGDGIFKTYENISDYGWAWFVLSIPFGIIMHDAYFYWAHRAMHHKKLYKFFHLTHHRSHNPTPFTAYSFAPGEAVVMFAYVPILMLVVPMHQSAIGIVLLVMIFKNAFAHCGYELFPRGTLKNPILRQNTTILHHDMHHEKANGNYGFYFTWWDKLMGTEHADYEARFNTLMGDTPTRTKRGAKASVVSALIATSLLGGAVYSAKADVAETITPLEQIIGAWATEGYGVVIVFKSCGNDADTLCGDLVWAWNPDEIRKGAMGSQMFWGAKFENGAWRDGRLKNPENGKTYKGRILQRGADILDLKGCAGPFCKTQTWRRLESLPHWVDTK